MNELRASGLSVSYGDLLALHPLDLEIGPGRMVSVTGPSGAGKSTLLWALAGALVPTAGRVHLGEAPVDDRELAAALGVVVVPQGNGLASSLTAAENVVVPLLAKGVDAADAHRRTAEALTTVGLEESGNHLIEELSGGQQQRVALARALVMSPKVLLFDEPLSNLDAKLRIQVREDIRELQRRLGVTTVYVTHDQEEAMAISDVVVIMNKGKVEQAGSPEEIYHEPRSVFVADFIGGVNLLAGEMAAHGQVRLLDQVLPIRNPAGAQPGSAVSVAIRPEEVTVGAGPWEGAVKRSIFLGRLTEYVVSVGGQEITAVVHGRRQRLPEGAPTRVGFQEGALLALR